MKTIMKELLFKGAIGLLKTQGEKKICLSGELFHRVACWVSDTIYLDEVGKWPEDTVDCPFIAGLTIDVDEYAMLGKLCLVYVDRIRHTQEGDEHYIRLIEEVIVGDHHFVNMGGPIEFYCRNVDKEPDIDDPVYESCDTTWDGIDAETLSEFDLLVDIIETTDGTKGIRLTHSFDGNEILTKVLSERRLTHFSRTEKNKVDSTSKPLKPIYGFQITIGWIYAANVSWLIGTTINNGELSTFKRLKQLAKIDDDTYALLQEILFLEEVLGNAPIGMQVGADQFFLTVHLY